MAQECPHCGRPLTVTERTIRLHVGECAECHHRYTLLPHGTPPVAGAPEVADDEATVPPLDAAGNGAAEEPEDEADGAEAGGDDTPVCGNCGSELKFRAADEATIEVECTKCGETTRFRAEGERAERPEREARPSRGRPPFDRGGFGEAPRSRGCRRCGGPIDFEPLPDGGRVGKCRNCGNEFRLPPLTEERRGYGGPRRDRFSRDGRRPYRSGPPRGRRPRDGDDDRERPPRRRRRDED